MPRRRFSKEQLNAIAKARLKQKRACVRGNHNWWPDYGWEDKSQNRSGLPPKLWTVEQRFPMPDWDGCSLVCSARRCRIKGQMEDISPRKQKRMKEIVDSFIDNTVSLRENYGKENKENG